jgi:hypothetical protein
MHVLVSLSAYVCVCQCACVCLCVCVCFHVGSVYILTNKIIINITYVIFPKIFWINQFSNKIYVIVVEPIFL